MLQKSSGQGAGIESLTLYLRLKCSNIMNRFVSVLEKFKSVSDLVTVGVEESGTMRLRSSSTSIVLTAEFDELETKWSRGKENETETVNFEDGISLKSNGDMKRASKKRKRQRNSNDLSIEKSVNKDSGGDDDKDEDNEDDTDDVDADNGNCIESDRGREVCVQLRVLLKVLQCKSTEPHVVFIGIPPHGRYIHLIFVYNPDPREASSFNMLIKVPTMVEEF